jgi:putative hemolysin
MPSIWVQIGAILLLILVNGLFAMAEIAVVSARKVRLQRLAESGNKAARRALDLAETPNRFLSTIQIGITLIGILTGALGGAQLADQLAPVLARVAFLRPAAPAIALALVVLAITYLSLVLGELVPKRLGMNNPEAIAMRLSAVMRGLATLGAPLVSFLSWSTEGVLRLLGMKAPVGPSFTEDELTALLAEGTAAGVFEEAEHDMVHRVLALDERRASGLMTPRPDIKWLDVNASIEEQRESIANSPYSRFPVADASLDELLGEVNAKDLLVSAWGGQGTDLRAIARNPLYVPETMPALRVLEAFKQSGTPMALVIDEYGSLAGIVTLTDILEAIVGDIPSHDEDDEPEAVQREDGSWLVDGTLPTDDFRALLELEELPGEAQGLYQTVAGFVVAQLGRIPSETETVCWGNWCFEVVDMDGQRVDKLLLSQVPAEQDGILAADDGQAHEPRD